MVAIGDGNCGDDECCPACRFKAVLEEHIEWAAHESDETWHDLTGEMIVLMSTAVSMLTALRVECVGDAAATDGMAAEAAAAIARLGGVIHDTFHALMDDDEQGDDAPGDGL